MEMQSTQINIKTISEVKIKKPPKLNTEVAIYINRSYQYLFYVIKKKLFSILLKIKVI